MNGQIAGRYKGNEGEEFIDLKKRENLIATFFYVILYCGSGTGSLDRTVSRDSTLFCVPAGPAH